MAVKNLNLKGWYINQLEVLIPYLKNKLALKNGDPEVQFRAKAGEDDTNVVVNSQLTADISQEEIDNLW